MYARVSNLTNVGGRRNYVKNKKNREEVVGFFDTAPEGFWRMIAKENREQFQRSVNAKNEKKKCSEGREIVYGLPANVADQASARFLAMQVKQTLGVECCLGIHKKWERDENGERKLNVHAHIILAERTLLPEPIHVEEKRADRTYYYDAAGKKCKKADAVKVTPKGTIIQEECTRYFSNKLNFFNFKNLDPIIDEFNRQFKFQKFDITKHFPQRHIGKKNPKEDVYREHNNLIKRMNDFFDVLDAERPGTSAKEDFCKKYSVTQRFSILQTDNVREKFEAFQREFEPSEEVLRAELDALFAEEKEVVEDIAKAETVLNTHPSDFANVQVAKIYRKQLEEKYFVHVTRTFLEHLKERLAEIKASIAAIAAKLHLTPSAPAEHKQVVRNEREEEK